MANELATARAALVVRLQTITGLRVHTYSMLPGSEFPAALVRDEQGPRLLALGGNSFHARFGIRVYLEHGTDVEGWTEIEKYCEQVGTYSVVASVLADKTIGGTVDWSKIEQVRAAEKIALDDQGPVYFSAAWVVDVFKQVA